MKLTQTMIKAIICILLLRFADMANIAEKKKVYTRMRLSRNSRSNAKAREISTIIAVSLKFVSYFVKGYIDSKIIDKYKSLKTHLEAADENARNTQLFLNKYNGEKCTLYNRFGILHKSTHFFFKFQKFKNEVLEFNLYLEDLLLETDLEEDDNHSNYDDNKIMDMNYNYISDQKLNEKKISVMPPRGTKNFFQLTEKVQKKRKSLKSNIQNKETPVERRKRIKEMKQKKKQLLEDKLKKMETKLEAKMPAFQQKQKETIDIIEEGLNKIQEKTDNLINLYCTAHVKGLSQDIAQIRATIKKEIDDVSKKIDDHLKDSNFFTNALQVGVYSAAKSKVNGFVEIFSSKEKEDEDDDYTDKKSKNHKKWEEIDGFVGSVDTVVGDVAGDYTKLPAELIFEGTDLFGKYEKLEIGDVVGILEGGKVPDEFNGLTKEVIESAISKAEAVLYKATDKIDSLGEWVGNTGAFTGLVVSIFTSNKKLKPDADDIAKFKHKMTIFNGFFGSALNVLGKLEKISPIFQYVSAIQSVAEMFTKYLEYRNVVQYVEKKIGFVNNLTTQVRMKTLKYMANEVQNRCDLLMNSYDILSKNKKMFIKIFSDSKATDLEMYFDLKKNINKFEDKNKNNFPSEYKLKLEKFNKIEKDMFENVMESNSLITASSSDFITAKSAYLLKSKDFNKIKVSKAFHTRYVYGSFNKLLVATSPEEYKSLLEVGYEIIYHLDDSWAEKYNDFSKFNFLMGCRGCGEEVVSNFGVFPLEKFYYLKYKIITAFKKSFEHTNINYLTYDQNVIVYSTHKKHISEHVINSKEKEQCFIEMPKEAKALKGVVNFSENGYKKKHIESAPQEDKDSSYYVQTIRSLSQIYCKDAVYSHEFISKAVRQQIISEEFYNEEKKNGYSKLDLNHKQYVLTFEIIRFFSDDLNLQEKILLSCTKKADHKVCYFLKPIPEKDDDVFMFSNMPDVMRSLNDESKYYSINFIRDKQINFLGKTFIPITHFFNEDFKNNYLSFSDADKKMFDDNFNLGDDSELIEVQYRKGKGDETFYYDYFLMYDKEKIINKTQLSSNSEAAEQAKAFSRAVDELKSSVCGDKLCNNFFQDGNKRERYFGVSQELSIYNSFYNDYASQLNESSSKSNTLFNEIFDIYKSTEYDEIRKSVITFKNRAEKGKNFSNIVNGMIKKTFGGYFLDFEDNATLHPIENGAQLSYRKNKNIIIPPLMKIFGNDHNIFVKLFNFLTFNSQGNNSQLKVLELQNFESTFNQECYTGVRDNHINPVFLYNNNNHVVPASVYGRSIISPFFSLILDGERVDRHGNKKDLFGIPDEQKLNLDRHLKWDIMEFCNLQEKRNISTQICNLISEDPDFKKFYNTFLSTGQDYYMASKFKIIHEDTKEKTIIRLLDHFANQEMQKSFLSKCGYVIINIPIVLDQKRKADAKANYYFHVDFDFDSNQTGLNNKSNLEFYMSDKPGFNDLAFIQIIFNKSPKEKMNTFLQYNDSIASLFGYSYSKNKKVNALRDTNIFDEMDFDDYSFPILTKDIKKKHGFENTMFKAKVLKMKDLSTAYKREDICGKY